jgi:hypothetical protein
MANRHRLRRALGGSLAAVALGGGALLGTAPAAAADEAAPAEAVEIMGGCGHTEDPVISGAKAYWELSCAGGNITIAGWVEDTSSNGRCAKVKAVWPDANPDLWKFSEPACPKGDREHFRFTGPGNEVKAWLYEYNV